MNEVVPTYGCLSAQIQIHNSVIFSTKIGNDVPPMYPAMFTVAVVSISETQL